MTEEEFDRIQKGAHKASERKKCECGGDFDITCQAFGFSKEDLCFFDEFDLRCNRCGKEDTMRIPQHHMNAYLKSEFLKRKKEQDNA